MGHCGANFGGVCLGVGAGGAGAVEAADRTGGRCHWACGLAVHVSAVRGDAWAEDRRGVRAVFAGSSGAGALRVLWPDRAELWLVFRDRGNRQQYLADADGLGGCGAGPVRSADGWGEFLSGGAAAAGVTGVVAAGLCRYGGALRGDMAVGGYAGRADFAEAGFRGRGDVGLGGARRSGLHGGGGMFDCGQSGQDARGLRPACEPGAAGTCVAGMAGLGEWRGGSDCQ